MFGTRASCRFQGSSGASSLVSATFRSGVLGEQRCRAELDRRATAALCGSRTISATSTLVSTYTTFDAPASVPRALAQLVDDRAAHRQGIACLAELGRERGPSPAGRPNRQRPSASASASGQSAGK